MLVKTGILLITFGLIMLSPIIDFLPIDLWERIQHAFRPTQEVGYYKIIPEKESNWLAYSSVGVGLILISVGLYIHLKNWQYTPHQKSGNHSGTQE